MKRKEMLEYLVASAKYQNERLFEMAKSACQRTVNEDPPPPPTPPGN